MGRDKQRDSEESRDRALWDPCGDPELAEAFERGTAKIAGVVNRVLAPVHERAQTTEHSAYHLHDILTATVNEILTGPHTPTDEMPLRNLLAALRGLADASTLDTSVIPGKHMTREVVGFLERLLERVTHSVSDHALRWSVLLSIRDTNENVAAAMDELGIDDSWLCFRRDNM